MTTEQLQDHYRDSLKTLGLSLRVGDGVPEELPMALPAALRAWYEIAGRSPLNAAHNRIFAPAELRRVQEMVVFAEENQQVVVWAFQGDTTIDDPEVWQGQPVAGSRGDFVWFAEELPVSRFIIEMLRHTIAAQPPTS